MSFGNVSDFRGIPTGPLMGAQPAKTTHAAEGAGQTNLPATGVEGKLSVKQIAALYQSPAPGAPGKAVAGAAKELRNVGKPPDKNTGGADRLVRPKQTAAPIAAAKPPALAPSRPLTAPPKAESAETTSMPSVKDIAKMFDEIELPTLPTQSSAPQHTPTPSKSIAAQPQFQDIGLDMDAEIEQLNTMIEAKEGTPHEGYLINPSVIENSESGNKVTSPSDLKSPAAEAPAKPTVMAKTEGPKGKEEASSQNDLSEDDLGDDSDDDPVVLQSPGSFSGEVAETPSKVKEKDAVSVEDPVKVSQSGVTKVEIQGGKDSAPKSVKDLEAKVAELNGCKNFDERSNLLRQLTPGERQQVKQFISGNIMLLNHQLPGSKVENKELLKKQINELKTLETQVALSISVPEKIPKTSIERAELVAKNNLHMNDVVHYICDPCLYATCKNETFSKFRETGISNETLMNRFVLSYCGFAKTENVVAAIIEKFAEIGDNPSAQKNLLTLLSKVLASSSQSVNESPEAKAKVNEMVENFTKAELQKTEPKGALQTQLQGLTKQTKQSVPASELAESPQENGLTLMQILSPGKKSPQMIAEFASSLTSIQNRTYQSITPSEFFTALGAVKSKAQPNISESVKLFNNITNVAVQAILQNSSKDRMEMIKFFIDLQNQLIKNGDFQSAYALQAALNNAAVDRLDEMKNLKGEYAVALEKNTKLFSPAKVFANLTAEIRERKSKGEFYLPLISLALMQLTNANEMPNPEDKNLVSPYKILQFGAVIETACESQSDKNKGMNPPKHNVRNDLLNVNINPDDMYDRSIALQPRK